MLQGVTYTPVTVFVFKKNILLLLYQTNINLMAAEILTREDLAIFKVELFKELREVIGSHPAQPRKWLKSYEVKDLLNISSGTLQNMRINGTLAYTKIGGLIFYDYEDIQKLMTATGPHKRS
ncbi:hypothetical protein CLV59_108209 [Chitinophaga dinghuensis]|nr:hypothetical protein CLV59_108209 [Chitinophaga dinghuensis]